MVSSLTARKLVAVNPTGLIGGAEIVLTRLLDAAVDAGWIVEATVPDGALAQRLRDRGLRITTIPELKLPSGPRVFAFARIGGRVVRAARRIRTVAADADAVVANGVLTLPALRLARLDASVVWMVHDVIARRDWEQLTRRCRRAVSLAVAPSEAAARPVRALGIPTRVVRNGTPWPVLPAPADAPRPPVIGEAGALTPMKGQRVLLEAVARLARRDVVVELAGEAPPKDHAYAEELRRRAARPDLDGRVRFLGHVADVTERMRGWTIATLPSLAPESGGLAVLEAMSIGIPVIVADHGGPSEVVGKAGVAVPPGDPDALAAGILELLADSDARSRAASAGRRAVAEQFTLERQQAGLLDVLEEATRPRPASITWLVPDLVPGTGGTTRQTLMASAALARRGHDVRILTRRRDRALPRQELVNRLRVDRVGLPGSGMTSEKLSLLPIWARLLVRRRAIDVVQVLMYPDAVLSAVAAGLAPRTVMSWAGLGDATDVLGSGRTILRRIQHRAMRRVFARTTNTALLPSMQRELEALGISSEIAALPLDTARFRPPTAQERRAARRTIGLEEKELAVVYTGQLRRLKAVDRLVDAFAKFLGSGRRGRLVIVGGASGTPDSCEHELREQVSALGLDRHVDFTGLVRDVEPYLSAADVFVLPSTREGTSYSLIEAMACGIACVAPARPVGAEVIGPAGVVPKDNTPDSLQAALVQLADDPVERARLGSAAVVRARSLWGIDAVVDEYERIYDAVERRGRRR